MAQEPALLAVVERLGFDTKAGLAATGGDHAFYHELLCDFQRDYLDDVAGIRRETSPVVLERLAHDLKAVLRMLGETRIAQMAEAWEAGLRAKADCAREQAAVCDGLDRLAAGFGALPRL